MINLQASFAAAALVSLAPVTAASPAATELSRFPAPEARQGAAADARHVYVVSNSTVAKYDKATGGRVAVWNGDPKQVPHINACTRIDRRLVCANSNYPQVPQTSSVEMLDAASLRHVQSVALGPGVGSLTWVDRKDGAWWAGFANYDGRGGEPGRDHRFTTVVKFDDGWRRQAAWLLPPSVLERMKPYSNSGGAWGEDGLLYLTGHDAPELYVVRLPSAGSVLEHVATIAIPVAGQAVAWDRSRPRVLYGINRKSAEVVAMQIPVVQPKGR